MSKRILIAEDQADVAEIILSYLQAEGYLCEWVVDGAQAWAKLLENSYHLAVLDWMMAELDGLTVCQRARQQFPHLAILMVSARCDDQERVAGLAAGADDYLSKPFHPRELVARVRALLRRGSNDCNNSQQLLYGNLRIELQLRSLSYAQQSIPLAPTELSLFLALASRPQAILSRQELLDTAWGREFSGSERTVDSQIRSLRAKLQLSAPGNRWIESVWGMGYRFNPEGEPA